MTRFSRILILPVMALTYLGPIIREADAAPTPLPPNTETFTIEGNSEAGAKDGKIPFFLYRPGSPTSTVTQTASGVLLLIPGHNGPGEAMLDARWRHFADDHNLILLAPTFISSASPQEIQHRGYYYPELGSGHAIEEALAEVHQRTGVSADHILIFGFSAGAHFAHRFALWEPDRVAAFVAYSAGWWSDPTPALAHVPALIMCGESDPRYEPTRAFMEAGLALHLPFIWRSYKNTGHQLTPAARSMSEAFLAYYADQMKEGSEAQVQSQVLYGDIQTYQVVAASQKDTIPEEVRILLPSQSLADTWGKEK